MFAFGVIALAVAVGCVGRRPIDYPPTELLDRAWLNRSPTGDSYPNPAVTTVAGLAAALGADAGPIQPAANPATGKPLNVLVFSGGGKYGAFISGVLSGWTESGTRPEFDVVTGVSSGALIALFSFLGPKYDAKLAHYSTTLRRQDLFRLRPIRGICHDGAFATAEPLERLIECELNEEVMAELREAHGRGRRCFVATTSIMAQRATFWDVGALACSGRPDASALVRKVMLAACSIPAWTPAVEIDVEVNGCRYTELHADAGNIVQGFVRTANGLPPGSTVYVICAGKLYPDPITKRPGLFASIGGAVSNALYALFVADAMNMYTLCAVTKSNYRMIALPLQVKVQRGSLDFTPADLRLMYDVGFRMAATQSGWRPTPPGVEPGEVQAPRTGTNFIVP